MTKVESEETESGCWRCCCQPFLQQRWHTLQNKYPLDEPALQYYLLLCSFPKQNIFVVNGAAKRILCRMSIKQLIQQRI